MTHAFFKALLFLGAGSVIHAMGGEQDMRKMGGLKKYMSVTHATFLIGCIAIAGIPPFSGFFSKDEILAGAFAKSPVYFIVGVFTALLTAYYMFRLYATTFMGKFRGTHEQEHDRVPSGIGGRDEGHGRSTLHESPSAMTIPLILLAVLAATAGFLGIPAAFASNAHWLEHFLEPVFAGSAALKTHSAELSKTTEWGLMGVSVAIALVGTLVAVSKFSRSPELEEPQGFGAVLANKWYVDEFYNAIIVRPLNALGKFFNSVIEKWVIDWLVNGVGRLVQYGSRQLRLIQSGQVGGYVLLMVVGILVLFLVELFVKK
jgi:NADH-quinone oxidoreductase subunit L